jgi:hypothetical protein
LRRVFGEQTETGTVTATSYNQVDSRVILDRSL